LREIAPVSFAFPNVPREKRGYVSPRFEVQKKIGASRGIFSIEKNRVVCGIFQDIQPGPTVIGGLIQKAQESSNKNLETVQQIAYLLGENAAESEVILKLDNPVRNHAGGGMIKTTGTFSSIIDLYQFKSTRQYVSGDVVLTHKIKEENRVVTAFPMGWAAA